MADDPNVPMTRKSPGQVLARLWLRWGWLVRWGGTASVKAAFARVPLGIMVAVVAVTAASQVVGAVRWRIAMCAYGAVTQPNLAVATRLYLIALFYNTYLPGAVGGDVVRAVATRDCFGEHGATGALAVVFVERVLGLFAVFALMFVGVLLAGESTGIEGSLRLGSMIGGAAALAALLMLPLGRRLAPYLPQPLMRLAIRLPAIVRVRDFATVTVLSLVTQLMALITGWMILAALQPGVSVADVLLIVPAALATVFLPITVGGTGAREAVFVVLGGKLLGMTSDDAVAASLLLWLSTLIVGAAGGALLLLGRTTKPPPSYNVTTK